MSAFHSTWFAETASPWINKILLHEDVITIPVLFSFAFLLDRVFFCPQWELSPPSPVIRTEQKWTHSYFHNTSHIPLPTTTTCTQPKAVIFAFSQFLLFLFYLMTIFPMIQREKKKFGLASTTPFHHHHTDRHPLF